MVYRKPEVMLLTSAFSAIQGGEKEGGARETTVPYELTIGAYEADE